MERDLVEPAPCRTGRIIRTWIDVNDICSSTHSEVSLLDPEQATGSNLHALSGCGLKRAGLAGAGWAHMIAEARPLASKSSR